MSKTPRTKQLRVALQTLFAAEAPTAVILRRGPRTHYQLILWDLDNDNFTPGQWMRGTIRLCDLSPDGSKLLYWASQYHRHLRHPETGAMEPGQGVGFDPLAVPLKPPKRRKRRKIPRYLKDPQGPRGRRATLTPRPVGQAWTAISRPPYFSALAIWPSEGAWTGGGVFGSNNRILLNEDTDGLIPRAKFAPPRSIQIRSLRESGLTLLGSLPKPNSVRYRMLRHQILSRRVITPSAFNPFGQEHDAHGDALDALKAAGATWVEWVDLRRDPEITFACDGCIFRLRNWRDCSADELFERASCLADFTGSNFAKVPPPESAMRW